MLIFLVRKKRSWIHSIVDARLMIKKDQSTEDVQVLSGIMDILSSKTDSH